MIERARSLEGRWVLVYRYNERKTGQRNQSVRMLAHLMDLGTDGAVPNATAKKMVLQEAGGDVAGHRGRGLLRACRAAVRSVLTSWSRPAEQHGKPGNGAANESTRMPPNLDAT
jgi:hypothetical protein